MNREEILQKSRDENQNGDEREVVILASAGKIAAQIGLFICCVTALLQVILTNRVSYQSWTVYFSILTTLFLYKAIKLRRRHELAIALLYAAFFVMFLVLYILELVHTCV